MKHFGYVNGDYSTFFGKTIHRALYIGKLRIELTKNKFLGGKRFTNFCTKWGGKNILEINKRNK